METSGDKVEIRFTVDATEFWSEIFGAGLETVPWLGIRYRDEADWDTPGRVKVTVIDPDDSPGPVLASKVLTVEDLAKAASEIATKYPHVDVRDMDVEAADMVLQQAVLGKVVFG